jgi:hypothetical protein
MLSVQNMSTVGISWRVLSRLFTVIGGLDYRAAFLPWSCGVGRGLSLVIDSFSMITLHVEASGKAEAVSTLTAQSSTLFMQYNHN